MNYSEANYSEANYSEANYGEAELRHEVPNYFELQRSELRTKFGNFNGIST